MADWQCPKCRTWDSERHQRSHRCDPAALATQDLMNQLGPRTALQARRNQAWRDGPVILAYHRGFQAGREDALAEVAAAAAEET